jgi:hypothetical protein
VPRRKSQKYSVEHIAKAIWLSRYSRENIMGMLFAAYFDASGKEDTFTFLTVGGAGSPVKKWIRFEKQWSDVLRREGVSEFHATDFASSKGEYKGWKGDKARRSKFVCDLSKIIKENTNKLFLATVEMEAWRDVNNEYCLEEFFCSPYSLAGFTVVEQAMKWAQNKRVGTPLKIFFEDGDKGWGGLRKLCITHKHFEPIRLPKKEAVPFQVGDFLAWRTRTVATNSIKKIETLDSQQDILIAIRCELKSLDQALVRPVRNSIYSHDNLRATCLRAGIPRRRS